MAIDREHEGRQKIFTIAGLGEVVWDVYDERKTIGGAPANFVAHICLAGHRGILFSRVGKDALGNELIGHLSQMGVEVSHIQRDTNKPTGTVRIHLDAQGRPHFTCTRNVAFDGLLCDDAWRAAAQHIDAVLFGTLAQRSEPSRRAIQSFLTQAKEACKIFDLNLRAWDEQTAQIVDFGLRICQVIKLNEKELKRLRRLYPGPRDDAEYLHQLLRSFNIELAALTLGERGCLVITESERISHPGFPVPVVDTVGCGDAFAAGMIIQYLKGAPLEMIAAFANRLGAWVAMHPGAVPPWHPEDLAVIG